MPQASDKREFVVHFIIFIVMLQAMETMLTLFLNKRQCSARAAPNTSSCF
jgi:hypothetical protein